LKNGVYPCTTPSELGDTAPYISDYFRFKVLEVKEINRYITVYFFNPPYVGIKAEITEITTNVWCCISELRGSCARINIIFQRFSAR